ncbi:SH3 domain-containing protein [Saccharospirillum impatiens]|uniref:SH3 domain-containing protein n=1 Tax=Saccharospirillum impatiens TaxID=169438 RepID=UPI00041F7987|nr:SH3 domain-containing protein [Saccharospirillum impatiens]
MNKAKAIRNHQSNYPDPISFKSGDTLDIGELDTEYDGWVRVTDPRGKEGWAPLSLINITAENSSGFATGDYSAKELDINREDRVLVHYEHCQWSWVEHAEKGMGWVPSDCLIEE